MHRCTHILENIDDLGIHGVARPLQMRNEGIFSFLIAYSEWADCQNRIGSSHGLNFTGDWKEGCKAAGNGDTDDRHLQS